MRQAGEAFVVTNSGFTHDMRIWATNFSIHLVDRERLRQWAGRNQPADDTAYPATVSQRQALGLSDSPVPSHCVE